MFNIDQLVSRLQGRRIASGWMARCPAHDDRSPSLSIREANGCLLVHCHAGCEQEAVIAALRERGLWPERVETDHHKPYIEDAYEEQILANWFAIAAETLAEQLLEELPPNDPERYGLTLLLLAIRLGDASTLLEYRQWKARDPVMTKGLVHAGEQLDARLQRRLATWLRKKINAETTP